DDRLGGDLRAGLRRVVAVVEPDAGHLAGAGDRGADAEAADVGARQTGGVDPESLVHEPGEERPVDVRRHPAQVVRLVSLDEYGPLGPWFTHTRETHPRTTALQTSDVYQSGRG